MSSGDRTSSRHERCPRRSLLGQQRLRQLTRTCSLAQVASEADVNHTKPGSCAISRTAVRAPSKESTTLHEALSRTGTERDDASTTIGVSPISGLVLKYARNGAASVPLTSTTVRTRARFLSRARAAFLCVL